MKADETSDLIARALVSGKDIDFHLGTIEMWDDLTGSNKVRVLGSLIDNVGVLASAGVSSLEPGSVVLIGKYRTQYFLMGRIVSQDLAAPQFPVVLYPIFTSSTALGATGLANIPTGVLAGWEGRVRIVHPFIEVDGVWANASGVGSTTYALKLGGTTVGSWTDTTQSVGRRGPFEVTSYMGQDWLKIEIVITASTGTGQKVIQPLGVYYRQKPAI